jgi:hypothetical protein
MQRAITGEFFTTIKTRIATTRACNFCRHCETIRHSTGLGLDRGRGFGFREGNKARGRMIQHVKEKHPEAYAAARAAA